MTLENKITMYVEGQVIPDPRECFAVRGQTMIDVVHPLTGKTAIYGKTLADCQKEYPGAEHMTIEEFCRSKAEVQDRPVTWYEITEANHTEWFECLPPRMYGKNAFLVGEPSDHHALSGQPRYQACRRIGDKYFASSRPLTVKEFQEEPS